MDNNSDTILYLAPLQGFTDSVYRQAFVKIFYGIDLLMTPYATVEKNKIKQSSANDLLPKNNAPHSVIPQILVNNAEDFIFLANHLSDLGYNTINWNLGCPYPMVTNKTLGAGLLPHPEKVNNILEKALPQIQCKVSIKTRLGLDNPNEIFDIIPIINHFPIEEIIIHPRIGKQLYKGTTDINTFEKCLPQIKHTVVYNGDINTIENYNTLKKRFPQINHWMLGRGALADPFLPASIKKNHTFNKEEKQQLVSDFNDELMYNYSRQRIEDGHLLNIMKNHWKYLSLNMQNGKKLLKQIKKCSTIKDYNKIIRDWSFSE